MKLISEKELRELLKASELLSRLDAFEVISQNTYDTVLNNKDGGESFYEWVERDLDNLLNEYSDYNITFEDNYNFD